MARRKIPKVNMYDVELMFEKYVELATYGDNKKYIKKPISWALYQTWKWAEENEEVNADGND